MSECAGRPYFFRGSGYPCALQVEGDAAQSSLVGRDVHWRLLCVGQVHYLHMARVSPREGQQGIVAVWTQDTKTFRDREEGKVNKPR